jgi:hypothetical protein
MAATGWPYTGASSGCDRTSIADSLDGLLPCHREPEPLRYVHTGDSELKVTNFNGLSSSSLLGIDSSSLENVALKELSYLLAGALNDRCA